MFLHHFPIPHGRVHKVGDIREPVHFVRHDSFHYNGNRVAMLSEING